MSDLKAQSDKLRTAATIWSGCATDVTQVRSDLLPAVGQGDKFGALAGSSKVSENFDLWIQDMVDAAQTGAGNFTWLSTVLNAIAETFDGTDAAVAQSMDTLDRMV